MKISTKQFLSLFILILFAASIGFAQGSGYHLLKKFEVGGEGGWDYLLADSASHRLYISRSTHTIVVDSETGALVGDIPNTNGVHGIAIVEDLGRGFISDGRDNNVTIFDLKTLKAIGTVPTGKNPDAIMYDPASKRVFTFNGGSSNTTAINAADGSVAGTIDLGGRPEFAQPDGKGIVFVNIEDKSQIVAFDSRKLEVKNRWSIAPGEEPSGLAIDTKHHRLFAVCSNKKMIVLDSETGKVVAEPAIGTGPDAAAFDPETKFAFSSNGEGTMTVVHQDSDNKYTVVDNVTTQRGAKTMALDEKTHKVFLPAVKYGEAPAATAQNPRPRAPAIPGSFVILVFGK
ncbi:MAG TPA: YncE family protein [Pyrinomonadaceae bacterium]|nr:YncE family protein [Pyrinomonadaceae bacterium]